MVVGVLGFRSTTWLRVVAVAAAPAAAKWPGKVTNGGGSGVVELCCVGSEGSGCPGIPLNVLLAGGGGR
jgi:hypothetical protein